MELIDKSVVVAEIKRRISLFKKEKKTEKWSVGASQINVVTLGARIAMLEEILSFLDTLEVKEVDLDESARHYLLHEHISPLNEVLHQADLKVEMQYHKDIEDAYKTGFELGLKVKKGE